MRTKSLHLTGCVAALGAFAGSMAIAGNAAADDCPTFTKPVVVVGSSAVKTFVAKIGGILKTHQADNGDDDPIDVLYQSPGSCVGANHLLNANDNGKTSGDVSFYDATGAATTCTLTADTAVDIGISDVFADSCGLGVPLGVKDFRGPIQSMAFAVSDQSSQNVMSYEAAYLALGVGDTSDDFIFNDPANIWFRDKFSGTQQMIAHALGVPGDKFNPAGHSTNAAGIIAGLQASATAGGDTPTHTFGILGMDALRPVADVVPMAYQHLGQSCGYYPSTELAKHDMQNTRDGHYFIQGPVHMFVHTKSNGKPSNAAAGVFVDYLTGAVEVKDLLKAEAALSIVPECAMRVSRDEEAGPLSSFVSAHGMCECAFLSEAEPSELPDECQECDAANDQDDGTNTDCSEARAHCHYGFCEVI
jgi:hypothetical protein